MLQLMAVALAVALLAAPVAASECLDRPANQITVVSPGLYTEEFETSPPGEFHTYDMRGAEWTANPPEKPITIDDNLKGACIVGPRIVGQLPRTLSWEETQSCCHSNDGMRFVHRDGGTVGHVTAEGLWIDNVVDGFEPVRYSNSAGLGYTWTLRSSYLRDIQDDVVENDACHAGEVVDVLADGVFTFISTRPGSGKNLDTGAMPPVIKVHDSLIHIDGGFDYRGGSGKPWKWPGSSSSCTPEPVLDVRNTVLRIDREHAGSQDWPPGYYENVRVVWLGGGEFPVPLPAGVSVTDDVSVWDAARSDWLERHGCDANGDACTNLHDPLPDSTSDDPPPDQGSDDPPPPPPSSDTQTVTLTTTFDTHLREASPTVADGALPSVNVDGSDGGGEVHGLLWFEVASQVPAGSRVLSATLWLETTGRGSGADFHRMLVPWDEDSTWESTVDGIQADGVEAEVSADLSTGFVGTGSASFDVTTSVQAWVDGDANNGWALLPLGNNGWDFDSREGVVAPRIIVIFDACDPTNDECTDVPEPGSDDPPPPPPPSSDTQTVTFTTTHDTYLREASPTVANGTLTSVNVDGSDGGGEVQGLLWFDVASGIRAGSTILSATLSLETTGRGSGADFHRMLVPWDEDSTWESTVDGIQVDGVEAEVFEDLSTEFVGTGSASFDVTTSVQAWVDGEANYGWALLPLGSNGWDFDSREGAVPPTLIVTLDGIGS